MEFCSNPSDWKVSQCSKYRLPKSKVCHSRNDLCILIVCLSSAAAQRFDELEENSSLTRIDLESTPHESCFLDVGELLYRTI